LELPVEEQMQEALEYLVQLLVRAGTDVLHLISIKIYLSDNRDMGPVVKVWDDFFTKLGIPPNDRPVRNTVISHGFSKHRLMKVELHGHAVLPGPNETALAKGVP
jgi:enamine deaminase RidA (YjgF/YER057c/UK114 family)